MLLKALINLYIDPGTGSMLLQILAGGVIASAVFFKKIWYSVVIFFKGKSKDSSKE